MTGSSLYNGEEIEDLDKVVEEIVAHDVLGEVRGQEKFYRWCREGLEFNQPSNRGWGGILSRVKDVWRGFWAW